MHVPYKLLVALLFSCLPASSSPATEVPEKPLVIEATIPRPGDFMRSGFGSVWMMSGTKLVRINPADNSFTDTKLKGIQGAFRGIAIGEGAVWVPDVGTDTIHKFDPESSTVTLSILVTMNDSEGSIGVGEGSVWVAEKQLLTRFNAASGAEEAKFELPGEGAGVAVAFGSVWVTSTRKNALYRIDPKANAVTQTIALESRPRFLTADADSLWILDQGGFVQAVDGKSGKVTATIIIGTTGGGGDINVGAGFVWLATQDIALMQIDPKTKSIIAKFHNNEVGDGFCFGGDAVWISGDAIHRVKVQ
jgi:virginiamycin B lyase